MVTFTVNRYLKLKLKDIYIRSSYDAVSRAKQWFTIDTWILKKI